MSGLKLFVSNISHETTDQQLEDHFKPYGEIVWAQVVKDRNTNESKGYGFITYKLEEDGEKALKELNGSLLHNRRLEVEKSTQGRPAPADDRESREPASDEIRLFVGGLPDGCAEADLMELFADAEPIEAFVCRQKEPPCGFVTIKRSKENLEAAEKQDGIYFKDSKWRLAVKPAKPPRDERRSRSRGRGGRDVRLFVGGLPEGITEDELMKKFRDSDPIDAFVPPRQTATPYYGFITIPDERATVKNAFNFDQQPFTEGSEHRMAVAYSKPRREDRDRDRGRYGGGGYGGGGGGGYGRGRSRSRSRDRFRRRSRSRSYDRRRRSRSRSPSYGRRRRSPSYDRRDRY